LLKFATAKHIKRIKIGANLAKCFEDELNPVALKAQRRVPLPDGYNFINLFKILFILSLNLDEWINEPDTSDNNEDEEDEASNIDLTDNEVFYFY
jgi:AP-3 complex subunit delta